jgi:hypothetical protein
MTIAAAKNPAPAVHGPIRNAVHILRSHPSVVAVDEPVVEASGVVTMDIRLALPLPSAWLAEGKSPNGVSAIESATFLFWPDYPLSAPLPLLRANFDRALAHVMPGCVRGRPIPCLYEGRLSELLQQRGFVSLLEQLLAWLTNAAMGTLIDPEQGWEPVRRDSVRDTIIGDGAALKARTTRGGGHTVFPISYLRMPSATGAFYHAEMGRSEMRLHPDRVEDVFNYRDLGGGANHGTGLALFVWPGRDSAGRPFVADRYLPETVSDIASLRARAAAYGCETELRAALHWLEQCIKKKVAEPTCPVVIVLAARRPFRLIGSDSSWELAFYMTAVGAPTLFPAGDTTVVSTMAHRELISPALLARLSGIAQHGLTLPWTMLGAGSLGSKIAIHLARSGRAPNNVVDNGYLMPHMAARHALVPPPDTMQGGWLGPKAQTLANAIAGLGQTAYAHSDDIAAVTRDPKLAKSMLPKKAWAAVNTTASLVVREALGSVPHGVALPRIIETGLMAKGTIGFVTAEGPKRNPDTAELFAEAYELIRKDVDLRTQVFGAGEVLSRQLIGDGCGSMTMTASDADISAMAAPMASIIGRWHETSLPEAGTLMLAHRSGWNLGWAEHTVPPCIRLRPDNDAAVRISLAGRAQEKIATEVARWPKVETGGILLGRYSETAQTFYVVEVMDAPADSERSAGEFVLGVQGVRRALSAYTTSVDGCLYCIGTWHSHLNDCGPSSKDKATAAAIALARPMPSVLLIKTAAHYRALVANAADLEDAATPTTTAEV